MTIFIKKHLKIKSSPQWSTLSTSSMYTHYVWKFFKNVYSSESLISNGTDSRLLESDIFHALSISTWKYNSLSPKLHNQCPFYLDVCIKIHYCLLHYDWISWSHKQWFSRYLNMIIYLGSPSHLLRYLHLRQIIHHVHHFYNGDEKHYLSLFQFKKNRISSIEYKLASPLKMRNTNTKQYSEND